MHLCIFLGNKVNPGFRNDRFPGFNITHQYEMTLCLNVLNGRHDDSHTAREDVHVKKLFLVCFTAYSYIHIK